MLLGFFIKYNVLCVKNRKGGKERRVIFVGVLKFKGSNTDEQHTNCKPLSEPGEKSFLERTRCTLCPFGEWKSTFKKLGFCKEKPAQQWFALISFFTFTLLPVVWEGYFVFRG